MSQLIADNEPACESSEEVLLRIQSRYDLTRDECMELVEEIQEHLPYRDSAALSEFWKLRSLIERGVRAVQVYVIKNKGSRNLAEGSLWLLLGFHSLAGASTMSSFARTIGASKQAVNKCMRHLQFIVPELPEIEGQRDMDAVERMRKAAKKTWHKKNQ